MHGLVVQELGDAPAAVAAEGADEAEVSGSAGDATEASGGAGNPMEASGSAGGRGERVGVRQCGRPHACIERGGWSLKAPAV